MISLALARSNQYIIAAARVNGLEQFLEALKIGVVVRRHWPRGKSVCVLLSSDDGGDSIQ